MTDANRASSGNAASSADAAGLCSGASGGRRGDCFHMFSPRHPLQGGAVSIHPDMFPPLSQGFELCNCCVVMLNFNNVIVALN
jgi:hypothetical protein